MDIRNIDLFYQLSWPLKYFRAPEKFNFVDEGSINRDRKWFNSHCSSQNNKEISIAFMGDLMGVGHKYIEPDDSFLDYIRDIDILVFNLEGPIFNHHGFILSKQYTYLNSLKRLVNSLPSSVRIIAGLANNHLADFGESGFRSTLNSLESLGIDYFGTENKPYAEIDSHLILDGINTWQTKGDVFTNKKVSNIKSKQRIEFIHWGDEFSAIPNEKQEDYFANKNKNRLMIVGHHSHTPQKISYDKDRLCAYSLGNAATYTKSKKINTGIILKVNLERTNDWQISETSWRFLRILPTEDSVTIGVDQ